VAVAEVTQRIAPYMILGHGARGANPGDRSVRTFGAQCVEVEVDVETGEVTVLRVVASHDCGRIVNPMMVESQVIGAVTQGLGFALTEERVVDTHSGVVLNANLEEYKVPTVADVPSIVHRRAHSSHTVVTPPCACGTRQPPIATTGLVPSLGRQLW
jgi:xanthine dehydrogenase YagR molybdenum-binding subunit